MYTSVLFHGSLLHVLFNMLALVPLGTELERIMGSVRLLYLMLLLATTNSVFHLIIALLVANNPIHPFPFLETECAIGFSGILFAMIVIETSLSGVQSRRLAELYCMCIWFTDILNMLILLLSVSFRAAKLLNNMMIHAANDDFLKLTCIVLFAVFLDSSMCLLNGICLSCHIKFFYLFSATYVLETKFDMDLSLWELFISGMHGSC